MCIFVGCSSGTKSDFNKEAKTLKNNNEEPNTKKTNGEAISRSITVEEFLTDRYDGQHEIIGTLLLNVQEKGEQSEQKVFKVAVEGSNMIDVYLTANPETLEIIHFTEFNWEAGIMAYNNFEDGEIIKTLPLNGHENNFFYLHRNDPLKEIADRPGFGI